MNRRTNNYVEIEFYALAGQNETVLLSEPQYDKRYNDYTKAVIAKLPPKEYALLKNKINPELKRLTELLDIQQRLHQKLTEKDKEIASLSENLEICNKEVVKKDAVIEKLRGGLRHYAGEPFETNDIYMDIFDLFEVVNGVNGSVASFDNDKFAALAIKVLAETEGKE